MTRVESSILVSRSRAATFSFLRAGKNHLKFIPNMVEFNQTSAGEFAQTGTTVHGVLRILGIKINVLYRITEYETDSRLTMKGTMGSITFKDGYILQDNGNNTRINFWLEPTFSGWSKPLSPFSALIGKVHAYETLRNLKREIEETG